MPDRKIFIFGKEDCGACKKAKHRVGNCITKYGLTDEVPVVFMDMDSVDGLTEGAFRDVWDIPTTIVEQGETTVARWDGEPPKSESLRECLAV